jgi:hypothetical protein
MMSTASNLSIHNATCVTSINVNEDSMMTDISTVTSQADRAAAAGSSTGLGAGEPVVRIERLVRAGYALAVGENLSNQLGLGGDVDNRKKPQIIKELPTNVVQVASGGMHSACLTQDGIVSLKYYRVSPISTRIFFKRLNLDTTHYTLKMILLPKILNLHQRKRNVSKTT